MFGRDLRNSRYAPDGPGLDEARGLEIAWTASVADAGAEGDITGTPIVVGDCVFAGTNAGWVVAVDRFNGEPRWASEVPLGGGINSSLAVDAGRVFAHVSLEGTPYLASFDAIDGGLRWQTPTADQEGSDAFSSPVIYQGMVFVGVSGDAAQHSGEDSQRGFPGSFILIDAENGSILRRTYTITPKETQEGFGGATISVPPAIDDEGFAYAGTSSAYIPQQIHPNNDAIIKIDLRRTRNGTPNPSFGAIVGRYRGDTFDTVLPGYSSVPCVDLPVPAPPAIVPTGRGLGACGDVDVDFAAAPNLLPGGLVVAMQKSGAFHAVDTATMTRSWRTAASITQPFGGVSAAFDGDHLIGGATPPGQLIGIDPDGALAWMAPLGDGAHYGLPVSAAAGVAYTLDIRGLLHAVDASDGSPLAVLPLAPGRTDLPLAFGGVSVAYGMVFASVGFQSTGLDAAGLGNGLIVAFR